MTESENYEKTAANNQENNPGLGLRSAAFASDQPNRLFQQAGEQLCPGQAV